MDNPFEGVNRQYVGARYVPKFFSGVNGSTEWVQGVQYEPLTIVTFLGNSYTSKKPVPTNVGNPAQNPLYWANTGNYNAQIAELSAQLAVTSSSVDELNAKFYTQNSPINRVVSNPCLFISDSYGFQGNINPAWTTYAEQILDWKQGCFNYNAYNGAGFSNGSFLLAMTNWKNDNPIIAPKIKRIIVVGGLNDGSATAQQLDTGMSNFFNYAKQNFPDALLTYIFVGNRLSSSYPNSDGSSEKNMLEGVKNYSRDKFRELGGTFFDVSGTLYTKDLFASDEIHPNDAGAMRVASVVCDICQGGNGLTCEVINVGNNNMYVVENNMVHCEVAVTATIDTSTPTDTVLSTINGFPVYSTSNRVFPVFFKSSSGQSHIFEGYIRNKNFTVSPYALNPQVQGGTFYMVFDIPVYLAT